MRRKWFENINHIVVSFIQSLIIIIFCRNPIRLDDEGTIYYFNEFTGETRWDVPGTPPVEELTDAPTTEPIEDEVDQVADANDVTPPAVAEKVAGRSRKHEIGELDSSKLVSGIGNVGETACEL